MADRRVVSVLIDAAAAPPPSAVAGLLTDLGGRLAVAPDVEASLVLEPGAAAAEPLATYRAAGINRLVLRALTLDQEAATALVAASALFPTCGVDLTFGRPGQTVVGWREELRRARQAGAGHISIEEHFPAEGAGAAGADLLADLYHGACEGLSAAGMPPYESGHCARPGHESRHLLHGATGGDYLGVGPGAASRITVAGSCHALTRIAPAADWLRAVQSGAETGWQVLSPEQRLVELILTGLRLRAGVERSWFEPLVGCRLEATLAHERLAPLVEDGFLMLDRDGLRLSERGWPLCDAVLARLLA